MIRIGSCALGHQVRTLGVLLLLLLLLKVKVETNGASRDE